MVPDLDRIEQILKLYSILSLELLTDNLSKVEDNDDVEKEEKEEQEQARNGKAATSLRIFSRVSSMNINFDLSSANVSSAPPSVGGRREGGGVFQHLQ